MSERLSPYCLLVMYALENYQNADTPDIMALTGIDSDGIVGVIKMDRIFSVLLRLGRLGMLENHWVQSFDRPALIYNLSDKGRTHLAQLRGKPVLLPKGEK